MSDDPKFNRIVSQGDELAKQNKYDNAIAKYQRALRINPHSSEVRRNLIDICKKKGAYREAISEYINWAEVCKKDGHYDQAIEIFQECLNMDSFEGKKGIVSEDDIQQIRASLDEYAPEIHWNLGRVYLARGDLAEAASEFKKSIDMNPSNPSEIHKHLGIIYTEQGKLNEAIWEYQEVIRLTPDDASVYEQLGEICEKQHKSTSAIQWYSQAGDIYLKKNEVQEAIRVCENILKFDAENIDILTKLSEIYSNEGLLDKAIQTSMRLADIYTKDGLLDKVMFLYERLLDWEPSNKQVRENVIGIYKKILTIDTGNLQARHKLINNLRAIDDIDGVIVEYIALGKTYLEKNLYEEGSNICEQIFEFDSKNIQAHTLLAEIYTRQGFTDAAKEEYLLTMNLYRELREVDKANETYQRMTSLFPDSAEMHYELALNHFQKNELDDSIKEFKLVIESDPHHIQALSKLGEIYIQKNMLAEGIDCFKKVLELSPGETKFREKLVDVYQSIGHINEAMEQLLSLGDVYSEQGEFDRSIDVYRRILCYRPDMIDVREKMIQVYYTQGARGKAKPEYIFLANVYDKKGIYTKAIEMCKKALEVDSNDINLRKKLCTYYVKQGVSDIAVNEYIALADIYLKDGLVKNAIDLFKNVIELQPDSDVRLKLIDFLCEQGMVDEAIEQYMSLADIYLKAGKEIELKDVYKKIITLKPDEIEIYKNLSDLYIKSKEIDSAVSILQELSNIYNSKKDVDGIVDIYQKIIDIYISEKMFEDALVNYKKVIELYSAYSKFKEQIPYYRKIISILISKNDLENSLIYHKDLATLLSQLEDYDSSILEYKAIIQSYLKINKVKETIEFYKLLINLYLNCERLDEAVKEAENILSVYIENKYNSNIIEIYILLINIYSKQKQVLKVAELQKNIGNIYLSENKIPKAIENYQLAAKSFIENNNYQNAIQIYDKITELEPDNLEYRQSLLDLYGKIGSSDKLIDEYCSLISSQGESGNIGKALDIFKQSIKLHKDQPSLYYCMANVYFNNQMWDDAIDNYRKVIEQDSTYPGVYSRLTLSCANKGDVTGAVEWTKKLIFEGRFYEIFDNMKFNKDPDNKNAELYYKLGIIYKEVGFIEDSIVAFRIASNFKPMYLSSIKMIGDCFLLKNFEELALKQYRQILDVELDTSGMTEENYLDLRYDLARTFEHMGKFKDAKKAYEVIMGINIKFKDTTNKIFELTRKIEQQKESEDTEPKVIEFNFDE